MLSTRDQASSSSGHGPSVFTGDLLTFQPVPASLLPPLAMWPAFPASDYYGGSAPPRSHQLTTGLPVQRPGWPPARATPGWFPRSLRNRSAGEVPSSAPAASPRVRRSPSSWPPDQRGHPTSESPTSGWACTAPRPTSARLEPVSPLRGFDALVPLVHLPALLAGPGPSGSADPSRRCRGCSHLSLRLQGSAAPSFNRPATTSRWRDHHIPARLCSASWRTTAVRKDYQNEEIDTSQPAVPEQVSVALAELAGEMGEGLLALAVGTGTGGDGRDHGGRRHRGVWPEGPPRP